MIEYIAAATVASFKFTVPHRVAIHIRAHMQVMQVFKPHAPVQNKVRSGLVLWCVGCYYFSHRVALVCMVLAVVDWSTPAL